MEQMQLPRNTTANLTTSSPDVGDPTTDGSIWGPFHVVLMAIILALAFLGNTSICWIILTDQKLRSVPNTLVLNLAACGLFTVIANGPLVLMVLSKDSQSGWTYGNAACQFNGFTTSVYGLASVLTLALISVNRYQMVRRSTGRFASWFNRSSIKILISGLWFLSALLSFPPVVGWSRYEFIAERAICTLKWSTEITYTVFVFTLGIFLPFVVMFIAYAAIFRLVRKKFKRMRSHSTRRKDGSVSRNFSNSSFGRHLNAAVERHLSAAARRESLQSTGPPQADSVSAVSVVSGAVGSNPPGPSTQQMPAAILSDVGDKDQVVSPASPEPITLGHHLSPGVHSANRGRSWSLAEAQIKDDNRFLQVLNNAPDCEAQTADKNLTIAVPVSYQTDHSDQSKAHEATPSRSKSAHPRVCRTSSAPEQGDGSMLKRQKGSTKKETEKTVKTAPTGKATAGGNFRPPKDDVRVTVMVCTVLTSFILCWLPITFINFLETAWDGDVSPALNIFSVYMMFASSAINPLIYGMLNRNFRSGFKRFFCGFFSPRGACRCCLSTKMPRQNRVSVINVKNETLK